MTVPDWLVLLAYFFVIVFVGMWFAKYTRTTKDFFFGGQRFSWWLIAISCVATLVGSYSFVQYSEIGFNHGFCSLTPYTNDWFVLPMFLLGWLPIIYYSRVASIPEYFERRFDRRTRMLVLLILLVYLQGYVGINLLTIGELMNGLFGWPVVVCAAVMAVVSGVYLHAGGQTSVLMTDLFQGALLLAAGLGVLFLGIAELGGFAAFWDGLPPEHRFPFADFNRPPELHAVGNFWSDAVTASFAFYFINQGVLMRFMAVKSVREGRRAMLCVILVLMPVAAVAVGGAGWVGQVMVSQELLPVDTQAKHVFVDVARKVCGPGFFGLVIAAMIAALMSTLDTLITAVSAVAVNDIWKTLRPRQSDAHYLHAARVVAIISAVLGIALIPVFQKFESIYEALSAFIAMTTPPLVVAICLAVGWKRFTARAAFWSLLVGSAAILVSLVYPPVIAPLAHGVSAENDYSYMRSLFGLTVTVVVALGFTAFEVVSSRVASGKDTAGLTLSTLEEGAARFKGGRPNRRAPGRSVVLRLEVADLEDTEVRLPPTVMEHLEAEPGDLLYLSDARWWLGGLRSVHVKAGPRRTSTTRSCSLSPPSRRATFWDSAPCGSRS